MGFGSFISRTAGIATLGFIGYDAHISAKSSAVKARNKRLGDRVYTQLNRLSYMNSTSTVHNNLKKNLFQNQLDTNWRENIAGIKGYITGFCSYIFKQIIPVACAVAATAIGSIVGATGLAVWGACSMLADRGIGVPRKSTEILD